MPPKCKSSHSFYVFLLSHHTSQASIQRISRSHTFHSPCLSDEGGNSFGCIIRPRNSISYIFRRCLSHGTKGSCQVLIEDMMVVRIFKIRVLTEKDHVTHLLTWFFLAAFQSSLNHLWKLRAHPTELFFSKKHFTWQLFFAFFELLGQFNEANATSISCCCNICLNSC